MSAGMLEHYSHIRMEAKRTALDAMAQPPKPAIFGTGSHQDPHQISERAIGRLLIFRIDWWAWVELNYRPHPYQLLPSVVRPMTRQSEELLRGRYSCGLRRSRLLRGSVTQCAAN
jgi:hypothetical protein